MMINNIYEKIYIKYKTVIIVQYKIADSVPVYAQSNENYNKSNINHSSSWFLPYKNQ